MRQSFLFLPYSLTYLGSCYQAETTDFVSYRLTRVGGIIAPLQSFYLSTTTVKRPTSVDDVSDLADILDFTEPTQKTNTNSQEIVLRTRIALTATNNVATQGRLWSGQSINCSSQILPFRHIEDRPKACTLRFPGKTLGNMSLLPDPFLAQLPSDYGTGLIRQYLLRINSTAQRNVITESESSGCENQPGAFYVKYGAINPNIWITTLWDNWTFIACMPADSTRPPWRLTRDRQDFSESLYLNLSSLATHPEYRDESPEDLGKYFRITVNTTAGYFELPNYMNGQQPGPLLDLDPTGSCGTKGTNCSTQSSRRP